MDLGLRTGLALFERDGWLRWYRSQHFGTRTQLRRAVPALLETSGVTHLVLEGGGPIALIWVHEARRRGIAVRQISAEVWRNRLLTPKQQLSRERSKQSAQALARQVIAMSNAPKPTSLRHDAAEAILIGYWAVLEEGWREPLS